MAAHARDVNILIWTPRKSVGHGTNDRVMVHGDGTRADGRRSEYFARISQIVGSRSTERGPSAPVPSIVDENWAGVDMMYHLDGRRHRQSLVYFGEPQDLVI